MQCLLQQLTYSNNHIEDGRRLLFSPLSVCLFVCLFVCEQYYGKTPRRISTNLSGEIRYGPRIMPLDFGRGPKSIMAAMAAILKKYLNFCFHFYML